MIIKKKNTVFNIKIDWDTLTKSVYQNRNFLSHLEKQNPCLQRYYLGYKNNALVTGAVVYSLKVNILTFSKYCLNLPLTIIGIPASVDAVGIVGKNKYHEELLSFILKKESGLILCLNYDTSLEIQGIIEMQTLPTLMIEQCANSWQNYLQSIRHNYRRRILRSEEKISNILIKNELCNNFTDEHYQLYLNIMQITKTKLEILSKNFFVYLPSEFKLYSYYHEGKLLTWHITTKFKNIYYFLFGGLNYDLRDKYDAYYNNLIQIIREAIAIKSKSINLGQTAEIPKNRLGARLIKKKMFIYHHNVFIRSIFRLTKGLLNYKTKTKETSIYKKNLYHEYSLCST